MALEYTVESAEIERDNDQDPIVSFLLDLYNEYKDSNYRKEKIKEIKQNREDYDGYRKEKDFPWPGCANYSLMVPAIVLDNIEPRIVNALIGKERDILQVKANKKEVVPLVPKMEEFAEWALLHNVRWQKAIPKYIHELLIDGTIYIFPYYEEKVVKQKERFVGTILIDPTTGERIKDEVHRQAVLQAGIQPEERLIDEVSDKEEVVFRVVNELVTMEKVYGPDETPDWDESPTLRTIWISYDELKAQSDEAGGKGPYININEELLKEETEQPDSDSLPADVERLSIQPERTRKKIECIEGYIPNFSLEEGDDPDWCIITITKASHTIIRKQYMREVYFNNRKPIKRLLIFPNGDKQFGTGIPHKIRHHAKAINDLLNQMIDSGTIQIAPFFFYNEGTTGLPHELEIQPGGANPVIGDPRNILFPQLGVTAQVFVEYINLITAFLERLIAVSSYASGVQDIQMGQGAGTAAGMRMILQEGQLKHNYQARPIREQLEEIVKQDMLLYAWFMPPKAMIQLPGGTEFQQVDVAALQGDFDFTICISDSAHNEMIDRREQIELIQLASQLPFVNQVEMFKELLHTYQRKDPERYINPAFLIILQAVSQSPEIVEVIQQYMQQKQQQQRQVEMQQQVSDNIMRADIKEQMLEPRKQFEMLKGVFDTLQKRKLMDIAEAEKIKQMNPQLMSDDDIKEAINNLKKKLAKDWVEAYLSPGTQRG